MAFVDWLIVVVSMGALTWFSLYAVRYMRSVADFLSANRSAGRYMLTLAGGMSSLGAISMVAIFEQYYAAGFPTVWWSWLAIPAGVIITLTGWVYYRFRETRCLTLAQFFEIRYTRRFRIFAGMIVWIAGIANFGIFPYVASNFFVYFCQMPETLSVLGWAMPTYWPVMLVTLGMALVYTVIGGQVTVMLTDCIQGIFAAIAFVILSIFLLSQFSWVDVSAALAAAPERRLTQEAADAVAKARKAVDQARKPAARAKRKAELATAEAKLKDKAAIKQQADQQSLVNPFKTGKVKDFNIWFFLIIVFNMFYGAMSWQGSQAYQSSGISPHEQKMGAVIGIWRMLLQTVTVILLAVCALTFLHHPQYSAVSAPARDVLAQLKVGDTPQLAIQQRVPIALAFLLPVGLRGMFCVLMIFLLVTTQDTYMHSWGSIFIQDVIMNKCR